MVVRSMNKKQQGFTLIEIAIVLLIIGLLLGGIMKGQSMIHIVQGAIDGDSNARVDSGAEAGAVWQHLAGAGFISGNYDGAPIASLADGMCVETTCPGNPYNGFYKIGNSNNALGQANPSHELATGGNIPVTVMYELDLKIDDGIPNTGRLRSFDAAPYNGCVANNEWDVVSGASDCAGVLELPL